MAYSIKSLGFSKVAVLHNGKQIKTFHGVSAPTDAKMHISKLHADNQPKPQKRGNISEVVAEMQAIQDNIGQFDLSMVEGYTEDEINALIQNHQTFAQTNETVQNPALAAWIGRNHYSQKTYESVTEVESADNVGTDKWQSKEQDPKPFENVITRAASTITISQQKAGLYGHGPFGVTRDFETKFEPNVQSGKAQLAGPNESVNEAMSVDIDHMGGADEKAKQHNITLTKTPAKGSPYSTKASGSKENLAKYLAHHYGDKGEAKDVHPEVYNESVEALDELSKDTLRSYTMKSAAQADQLKSFAKVAKDSGDEKFAAAGEKAAAKRVKGLGGAITRLTKEDVTEAELDEMISEVLGKNAEAGEWIKDFVNSENPKFEGKSKEKRKQMALAAYYAKQNESLDEAELGAEGDFKKAPKKFAKASNQEKQGKPEGSLEVKENLDEGTFKYHLDKATAAHERGDDKKKKFHLDNAKNARYSMKSTEYSKNKDLFDKYKELTNEDLDEEMLDEISKKTLGSYIKNAANAKGVKNFEMGYQAGGGVQPSEEEHREVGKRRKGIAKAVERLTKENVEITDEVLDILESLEVAQLDELSKTTLANYVKDASTDRAAKNFFLGHEAGAGREVKQRSHDIEDNRRKGIRRAVTKLAKESFADFIFGGEVIREELTYEINEADKNYDSYFKEMLKKAGISSIGDLKTDDAKKEFMNSVDAGFKAKNEDTVIENFMRADVEDKAEAHKKAGHKVSDIKFSTKDNKPHAEYVVTTSAGDKKKYIYHGTARKLETLA